MSALLGERGTELIPYMEVTPSPQVNGAGWVDLV